MNRSGNNICRYLGDLAHGDFGVSLKYRNHTVNDIIAQGLPVSMLLGALAFGFAMGVGLPAGIFHRRPARALAGLCRQFSGDAGRVRAGICRRAVVDSGFCHQMETAAGRRCGKRRGT